MQIHLAEQIVNHQRDSLRAVTMSPDLVFGQADAYIRLLRLLIQVIVVDPADVAASLAIDLPLVAAGRPCRWTAPTLCKPALVLLPGYGFEWLVGLVVVLPLFKVQPSEVIFIISLSSLIPQNDFFPV